MCSGFWIIITVVILCNGYRIQGEKSWTYDFFDIKIINNTPDILDGNVVLGKISRGVYGLDGFYNILEDIDDRTFMEVLLYYSSYGTHYTRTPLMVPRQPLTMAVNTYYKNVMRDGLRNCTNGAVYFEGDFVPPLTKRSVTMNKCMITGERFPDRLATGYYKLVFTISGIVNSVMEVYSHVYPK